MTTPKPETGSRRSTSAALVLAIGIAALTFGVGSVNLSRSPDTVFDEAVYTRAAQNVAAQNRLTWRGDPVFIHPPLYFLLQSSVIDAAGRADGELFDAIPVARRVTVGLLAVSAGLLVTLAFLLAHRVTLRRRLMIAGLVGVVAAFDPVLLRFGRLAIIEAAALAASLLVLVLAYALRDASWPAWLGFVGTATGIALLTKEITIFLVVVPFVYGIIRRSRRMIARGAASLVVGAGFWALFPVWAVTLGSGGRFLEEKVLTAERLLGTLQVTGWNRPGVSFLDAVRLSAAQYAASYAVLAAGVGALLWLVFRKNGRSASYLLAILMPTYVFGAFTILRGQLNEQFFVYLMPGAILGLIFGADALARALAARRSLPYLAVALPVGAAVVIAGAGFGSWIERYTISRDDGVTRMVAFIQEDVPACQVVNVSGDLQKYAYGLAGRTVTDFASGPQAVSNGVRYFLLSPKDAFARYGRMTPDLASYIRTQGSLVRSFESETYWDVQLWRVEPDPFHPTANRHTAPEGEFFPIEGAGCGGYFVRDDDRAGFLTAYDDLGGKGVLGPPASLRWRRDGARFQAFDAAVLVADGKTRAAHADDVIAQLSKDSPDLLEKANLPVGTVVGGSVRPLLNDPIIAERYLSRSLEDARRSHVQQAVSRWGRPLGTAEMMPDGVIRQPFESVVIEHRPDEMQARFAPIAPVLQRAQVIPPGRRSVVPGPSIERREDPVAPSDVTALRTILASGALIWLLLLMPGTFARRRKVRLAFASAAVPSRLP